MYSISIVMQRIHSYTLWLTSAVTFTASTNNPKYKIIYLLSLGDGCR